MFSKFTLVSAVLAAASSVSAHTTPSFQGSLLLQRESHRLLTAFDSFISLETAGANAKKCLRADNRNGAPVLLADCTGGSDQLWQFSASTGTISLYNGGKCLDVTNGVNAYVDRPIESGCH